MTYNASLIDDFMNPPDWKCCTVEQLWRYVAWHLENAGIGSVLVGGAALAIHTEGRYRTSNLDLVPNDLMRREVPELLISLGFAAQRNRNFAHHECPHLTIRLPMGPVEIGGEFRIAPDEIEVEGRRLRILSPSDCVKDRLASYAHLRSPRFLDQASLICQHQPARVDLGQIEHWCAGNGSMDAFKELKRRLMDIENDRFFPGLNPQTKPRLTISLFASELLTARRILTRLGFERLKSPLLTHVLVTVEDGTMILAVTDGVHWLESRIPDTFSHACQGIGGRSSKWHGKTRAIEFLGRAGKARAAGHHLRPFNPDPHDLPNRAGGRFSGSSHCRGLRHAGAEGNDARAPDRGDLRIKECFPQSEPVRRFVQSG